MDGTLFESLENQTAPESTRGLFDFPSNKQFNFQKDNGLSSDRRSSLGGEQTRPKSVTFQTRGHQRSRSVSASDFATPNSFRNNTALQTLVEEEIKQRKKKNDVEMDSLNHMINTLKNMPPMISPLDNPSRRSSVSITENHHQISNNSQLSHNKDGSDLQININNGYQPSFENKRRSKRSQSIPNTPSDVLVPKNKNISWLSRDEMEFEDNKNSSQGGFQHQTTRSNSISHEISRRNSNQGGGLYLSSRRYSESQSSHHASSKGLSSSGLSSRRTSLQMPSLNENETTNNSTVSSRRVTFNKPLNLASSNLSDLDTFNDKQSTGEGYGRRPSRNLDLDWRNTTNSRNSFHIVPFTPTRVNFARDDANPHQRRTLFVAHLPFSALPPLFRNRQISRGILRINKRNRSDAFVYSEEIDDDIYICGSRDRNRALEGDIVAVKLVSVEKVLAEKKEKEESKLARQGAQIKVRLPDDEDENEIIFGGDNDVNIVKPKYCGVVVAILERAQNQEFSGTLTLVRPNNKRAEEEKAAEETRKSILGKDAVIQKEAPRIVWFKATDKRVPLIAIPIEQTPKDFVQKSEAYANRLFVGSIKRWPITSLHPFGALGKELGLVSELSTQTKAILADNNVSDTEFSEAVYSCLPSTPFNLVADETRRDLRKDTLVFTIDPKNSNVLDDALSIKKIDNDLWEVGVHISDIGYFIKSDTALDKEARARGVRVDLVHTHVPLVPEVLTEQITNLSLNKSRFAFSVMWKIDKSGVISDTWFGKTIVRSSAQLSYEEAQAILDSQIKKSSDDKDSLLNKSILSLYELSKTLRENRVANGILTQVGGELEYEFGEDNKEEPITVSIGRKTPAITMVKELLFLANKSVAQKIISHFPEHALLRRQAPPNEQKISELCAYAANHLKVKLDCKDVKALESSIQSIQDLKIKKLISAIVSNTIQGPKYFCSGCVDISKYAHYSNNTPLYSHFTAPSRRFVDIITHRQLEATLLPGVKQFPLDRDTIQKLAQHCNIKKEAAIRARAQSNTMFLTNHMYKLSQLQPNGNVVFREAIVIAVFEQYFDVIIPELNLTKRIHFACLPVWRSDYNAQNQTLTMFWRKGVDTSTGERIEWDISDDEEVDEDALLEEMGRSPVSPQSNETFEYLYPKDHDETIVSQLTATLSDSTKFDSGSPKSSENSFPHRFESSRPSSRRASIVRARLCDSTAFNTEQGFQTIKALDKIRVVLIPELSKTPPVVRVLAANPFS